MHIHRLRLALGLQSTFDYPGVTPNALDYQSSNESFGICPLPRDVARTFGHEPYSQQLATHQGITIPWHQWKVPQHVLPPALHTRAGANLQYLACRQEAKYAIVPVHTDQERQLFSRILNNHFVEQGLQPDWVLFAKLWSKEANGKDIFYKTPESILTYYNDWTKERNAANTITNNLTVWIDLRNRMRDPTRDVPAPTEQIPAPFTVPNPPPPVANVCPEMAHININPHLHQHYTYNYRPLAPLPQSYLPQNNDTAAITPYTFRPAYATQQTSISPPEATQHATHATYSSQAEDRESIATPNGNSYHVSVFSTNAKKSRKPRTCTKCGDTTSCPGRNYGPNACTKK